MNEGAIFCYYKYFENAYDYGLWEKKHEEYKVNIIQEHIINDEFSIIYLFF